MLCIGGRYARIVSIGLWLAFNWSGIDIQMVDGHLSDGQ